MAGFLWQTSIYRKAILRFSKRPLSNAVRQWPTNQSEWSTKVQGIGWDAASASRELYMEVI
ncbi:hypothetical protein EAG_01295 [Camponotus floridanus]|uniref:Uncharacterized protein n=1 Tax=Camponotus floridanus TaxID=104421 RepID=E2AZ09_CAMFO|nr:hypothetical protein EAG_01295 [Camponotus floridanus]